MTISLTPTLLAQRQQPLGGVFEGLGPLGETVRFAAKEGAPNMFAQVASTLIGFLTIVAGLWFTAQFLLGAFGWLTAGSDKVGMENAKKRLTNNLVGLIIVIAAVFLIDLIGKILGLNILNPADFLINKIW